MSVRPLSPSPPHRVSQLPIYANGRTTPHPSSRMTWCSKCPSRGGATAASPEPPGPTPGRVTTPPDPAHRGPLIPSSPLPYLQSLTSPMLHPAPRRPLHPRSRGPAPREDHSAESLAPSPRGATSPVPGLTAAIASRREPLMSWLHLA